MPNEEKVTRKLRAIISADVKGYPSIPSDSILKQTVSEKTNGGK